jgi:hypothetical protein
MFKASSHRLLTMLLAAGVTIAVVVGLASATAPVNLVPTPEPPAPVSRTVVPGRNDGGLFADGAVSLPKVDIITWKTYANAKYGYSFKYPPDWSIQESDSSGLHGPNGEPYYPLQATRVQNPKLAQGANISGQTCQGDECVGPPPTFAGFYVEVRHAQCDISGDLLVNDIWDVGGKQGSRCVVESPNDRSRIVSIAIPYANGDYIWLTLENGRTGGANNEAVLAAILNTVTFQGGGSK